MIQALIGFISICILLLHIEVAAFSQAVAPPWPSCEDLSNTQDIFNQGDGNDRKLFDRPICTGVSYTTRCRESCCSDVMENKELKGIMASPFQAIRYIVGQGKNIIGLHPVPFFYYNAKYRVLKLAPWNPNKTDIFKFKVHYHLGHAMFQYAGTGTRGAAPLLAPWSAPLPFGFFNFNRHNDAIRGFGKPSSWMNTHAMAPSCDCGYYDAMEVKRNKKCKSNDPGCYGGYYGKITCVDIDECSEGSDNCDLIPNSFCVNTNGGFKCNCHPGYLPSGSQCLDIGKMIEIRVGPASTSARIFVTTDLPIPSWSFSYNISDVTDPSFPRPVYDATQVQVSQNMARSGVFISNLNPGNNYSVTWDVLDENNTVITDLYGYSSGTRFATRCTCGEVTDAPVLLGEETVTQEYGYIYFKFLGNSMCGNAYSFGRQAYDDDGNLTTLTVFTPNYYYSGGPCSPIPYEPGKSAADILEKSKLRVGSTYRYSIRPVGDKYLGDSSHVDFLVQWESSISGTVTLQPNFGDLPVEGVNVNWALKDENGTTVLDGNTTTTKSGRFTVHLNARVPFDNDLDYPVHLSFSKITEIDENHQIRHEFLCNNGRVNCTDTDLVVHLKHLDFNVPVKLFDATSVPVSGKVYIADTSVDSQGSRWGGDGCPVEKARVCLIDRSPGGDEGELVCTETAPSGTYTLPGVIGSRVSIKVSFNNHSFEYMPDPSYPDFSTGIDIQPHHVYERNDFIDTTTVPVDVAIAGGACDFFLGSAVVSYSITGCPWGGVTVDQPTLRNIYDNIPAGNMRFSVQSIADRPDIRLSSQNVDLRLVPEKNASQAQIEEGSTNANATNVTQVRFQYDGIAKIHVWFQGDMNDGCESMTPDVSSYGVDSIHVLPFQRPSVVTIFIERDLGEGIVCDAVDPSSKVMIHNNLGLIANDPSDDRFAVKIAASMPSDILKLLYHCNQGCLANVTQDYDETLKRNKRARIEFPYMTGRPNSAAPFTKLFIIQTVEPNAVTYKAAVVITGQYKRSELNTVGLPTYEPILVIRDPPGGSSYAFYENVQTTIRIESHKHTEYRGLDVDFKISGGLEKDIAHCAGLGIAVCQDMIAIQLDAGYHLIHNEYNLKELYNKVNTGGFTTTWSYKTPSSEPLFSGNLSDTYVVPNLNLKYNEIDNVGWNQSSCTASSTSETAFNLQSPDNVPALAFVTGFEIVNTEIPALELNIASTYEQLNRTTLASERVKLQRNLNALQYALQGWQDTLALNEELKQNAIAGNGTHPIKPHEWFDKIAKNVLKNETQVVNTQEMSHNSALLSEDLMSHAKLRYQFMGPGRPTDLKSTNTIKFSGGGNEFTFRLSQSIVKQHITDLGGSKKKNIYHGRDNIMGIKTAGFSFKSNLDMGERVEYVDENFRTDEIRRSTDVGFVLSDPDAGDQFDVDVFIDPHFGTFIFHTRSGKSVCKHEVGTENRQLAQMELLSIPPPVILENEPIVFHFRVTKLGIGSMGYMLSSEVREDVDALMAYPYLPREYPILEYGQSFIGTLTLKRGPEKYEYPAYTLILQPACEFRSLPLLGSEATVAKVELYNYIDPVDQSKKIVFARPCAPVILQGDIANDQRFMVTSTNPSAAVTVVVQNPTSSLMTWLDAAQDPKTRLKRVQLYYRSVGSTEWMIGQHVVDDTLVDIDFALAGVEDAYGFATVGWAVSHLSDGNYEMQVRTECDNVANAPDIFNGQETAVIQGVLDRKPPKLYGLPQPQKHLPIGQPIKVAFDENLDCTLPFKFTVRAQVDGIDTVFDNNNLLTLCEDRLITIQFDAAYIDMDALVGKSLTMNVSSVVDANTNLMSSSVSYSVDIVRGDSRHLSCQLENEDLKELQQAMEQDSEELRRQLSEEIKRIRQETHDDMVNLTTSIIESVRSMLVSQPPP